MLSQTGIRYSKIYQDNTYEYINVILPKNIFENITPYKILQEEEWTNLGVEISGEWTHYTFFKPEPHILLFRKPIQMNIEEDNFSYSVENIVED
jgi:cyclin-dependent kinase regulatory subunit CKS1